MRTVFIGAVEGSQAALVALCKAGHVPDLLVTLPPDLAHRHSDFCDLSSAAQAYDIPIHYTAKSDGEDTLETLRALAPDLILVIGWSQLCGAKFRAIPRLGCIGFHPAALPRLRGRAVIPWTILLGERQSGATLFWLDEGADTGDIAAQELFVIDPDTITARSLYDRQLAALCHLLPDLVGQIAAGATPRTPQDHDRASTCGRRRPEDGRIDWRCTAAQIDRLIRAVGPPYPGAFTHDAHGKNSLGQDAEGQNAEGQKLILTRARFTPRQGYFIGLPGQVQAIHGREFTVACGDGRCLDILDWTGADAPPKLHSVLGRATERI